MLIEKLIIKKTKPYEEVIRYIKFKKGLNLIVDNTSNKSTESGNNVGKSTVIKIIDLCLGAKSTKDIYSKLDTKSENTYIKKFLTENKVQAELILKDEINSNQYCIKRDLFPNGHKYINDKLLPEKKFSQELNQIIFHLNVKNPTFRQLIPKFIRSAPEVQEKMLHFIPEEKSPIVYDLVYCTLFQISNQTLNDEKIKLQKALKKCEQNIKSFESNSNIGSLNSLKQKEILLQNELEEQYEKRKNLSYIQDYQEELEHKRKISAQIQMIENTAQSIEFEISLINNSIKNLQEEQSNIDVDILKSIYKEAHSYIPNLQKTFEDLLRFHNKMIQNKIDFIQEQLPKKEYDLKIYKEQITNLIKEKKQITINSLDEGLLDDLNIINNKIESISQQKGEVIHALNLLEEQYNFAKSYKKRLDEINSKINEDDTNKKIQKFNDIFVDYCQKLYNEKNFMVYDGLSNGGFPIKIESLAGNSGTGKTKALTVAFDLAYIKYANKMNIPGPKFAIHDKLENTHINQLETIFEIADSIDGQYILPILRERIDKLNPKKIESSIILELSEDDKLFKI